MKQIIFILWNFLLFLPCANGADNSHYSRIGRIEANCVPADDKEAESVWRVAREVINELAGTRPEGTTTFYYTVENGTEALAFVLQEVLNHSDQFKLVNGKTNNYKYKSILLEVSYTEKDEDVAKVIVFFKKEKEKYTIIFRKPL